MTSVKFTVFVCSLLFVGVAGVEAKEVSQQAQTPLGRVLEVITKIRREVMKEEVAEEAIYSNFACFCKDKSDRLTKMVNHHKKKIDLTSANIGDWTATSNDLKSDQIKRLAQKESDVREVDDIRELDKKEQAEWREKAWTNEENKKIIDKAVEALWAAKNSVGGGHNTKAHIQRGKDQARAREDIKENFGFLQTEAGEGLTKLLAMADAMGWITSPKQRTLTASLLQGAQEEKAALLQGGPNPLESYGYHGGSDDIIDLVISVEHDMAAMFQTQMDESKKARESYAARTEALYKQIQAHSQAMFKNYMFLSTHKKDIAIARQELIENQGDLDETEHVWKEVTSACTTRADEYDARTSARKAELEALTSALACLGRARPAADRQRLGQAHVQDIHKHALLQATPIAKALPKPNHTQAPVKAITNPPSFLQELSAHTHPSAFLERVELSADERKQKALDVILSEGQRVNSLMLTSLASKIDHNPFDKVQQLLSDLMFRLEKEAMQETTKKVWCDEELKKTRHERETRWEESNHITMLVERLDANKDALTLSIKYNNDKAAEIGGEIKHAFTDTSQLNAEHLRQFAEQKEARDELKEAIQLLKTYYSQAAKAVSSSLLQVDVTKPTASQKENQAYRAERSRISDENEDRADKHDQRVQDREQKEKKRIGALDGDVPAGDRLGTMGDALALLETVASDFDREIRNLEGDMSDEYKQFLKTNDILKSQKVHAEELADLDRQELQTAKVTRAAKMEDLQTAQNLLDDALKELEGLKPTCIDTGMSYAERVAARKVEMAALSNALCILGETDKKKYGCK